MRCHIYPSHSSELPDPVLALCESGFLLNLVALHRFSIIVEYLLRRDFGVRPPVWRKVDDLLVDVYEDGDSKCALPMLRKVKIDLRLGILPPIGVSSLAWKQREKEARQALERSLEEGFPRLGALMQRGELELTRGLSEIDC